jgi:hypothetical protein
MHYLFDDLTLMITDYPLTGLIHDDLVYVDQFQPSSGRKTWTNGCSVARSRSSKL